MTMNEDVVIFPAHGRVYHRPGKILPLYVGVDDPEWFSPEDWAFPACRSERTGRLALRVVADENPRLRPCRRCFRS